MAVGRIGWVKKAISAVAMIALVFGLSVRPAFAAEAPAGEGSSGGSASSTTSGTGAGSGAGTGAGAGAGAGAQVLLGQAPRQLPESQALSQEWV